MEKTAVQEELERTLYQNLKIARQHANIQQKEACKAIGMKENYICRVEQGTRSVSAVVLYQLCKLYNVSMEDMCDKEYAQNHPLPLNTKKRQSKNVLLDEKPMNREYYNL